MFTHHVFFCTNLRTDGRNCCQDHDAQSMRDYLKKKVKELGLAGRDQMRINTAGCLDHCAQGPVIVVYPEAVWYSYSNREDIDEILEQHLIHGKVVERLRIE